MSSLREQLPLVLSIALLACGKSDSSSSSNAGSPGVRLLTAFGSAVATPGPLFEGLVLGGAEDARAKELEARWDEEGERVKLNVRVKFADKKIVEFHINPLGGPATKACAELSAALERAWGKPTELESTSVMWFVPDRKHRATHSNRGDWCSLTIEPYLTPAEIAPASLLATIGQPPSALDAYQQKPDSDGDRSWSHRGLGPLGGGINGYRAIVVDNKIVGLEIDGYAVGATVDELRAHVDTILGESTSITGVEGRTFRWKSGAVLTSKDFYALLVGGRPPPDKPGTWTHGSKGSIYHYNDGDQIIYGMDGRCRLDRKCQNAGSDCQPAVVDRLQCPSLPPELVPAN